MKYIKSLTYHCRNCGATVEPHETKCSYCKSSLDFKSDLFGKRNIRVFCETKNDRKIYLHETVNIGAVEQSEPEIDCTMLEDGRIHRVRGLNTSNGKFSLGIEFTKNSIEKAKYIEESGIKSISVESDIGNQLFKIDCDYMSIGMQNAKQDTLMELPLSFVINDFKQIKQDEEIYVNDGTTCPNCGAKLRQRFGLCDYCGGWVRDMNCYY